MSSNGANIPPWKPEDPTSGNRVIVALLIALAISVGAIAFRGCQRPEPVQMIRTPTPEASSAASATSSAHATGTQTIKGMLRKRPHVNALSTSNTAKASGPVATQVNTLDDDWEFVFEATQTITTGATASAAASSSIVDSTPPQAVDTSRRGPDHGRLGIIAATMPGILAADAELARVDVPPWLVGLPLEFGLDVGGNLEAGALGATVGGKAFAGVYAWSQWNLTAQGVAVGAGLRF